MTLDNRSPRFSSGPASWLKGKASKALIVLALAAAAWAISPSRVYAGQAGTLTVKNTNNPNPVVIDWAPLVRGIPWLRLGTVPAGRQVTFNIIVTDGAPGIAVRADSNDETIENENIDSTSYFYEPYP